LRLFKVNWISILFKMRIETH